MKHVWVAKVAHHDLQRADRFGERVVIWDEALSPFMVEAAKKHMCRVMRETPPKSGDYLLFSGPAVLSALLMYELLSRVGVITLLIFHARERVYVERVVYADGTENAREAAHAPGSLETDS